MSEFILPKAPNYEGALLLAKDVTMDVVKEMAFQASLDPKELESEKEVVISELERDQDSPMSRLFESLQTSTLQNTVYGRPIIGFKETVRAVTADDLRAYVQRWYQPQNMMLLVAGDIDPQAVLQHAQELFGGMLTETCCQIDLIPLFKNGFSTGHGHLREPNSIESYSALACIAIQANQNEMHGGQSVPHFDFAMQWYDQWGLVCLLGYCG